MLSNKVSSKASSKYFLNFSIFKRIQTTVFHRLSLARVKTFGFSLIFHCFRNEQKLQVNRVKTVEDSIGWL